MLSHLQSIKRKSWNSFKRMQCCHYDLEHIFRFSHPVQFLLKPQESLIFIIIHATYKQTMVPLSTGSDSGTWPGGLCHWFSKSKITEGASKRWCYVHVYRGEILSKPWGSFGLKQCTSLATYLFRSRLSPYQAILYPAAHIISVSAQKTKCGSSFSSN